MEVLFFNLSLKLSILQAFPCLDPDDASGQNFYYPWASVQLTVLKLILI